MSDLALEQLERHRGYLRGLAYRMVGSLADADDILQEAAVRCQRMGDEPLDSPRAFLTTLVTRLCLDLAKSARARRETYVGPWLPEPVLDAANLSTGVDTELGTDISMALMLALERLSPLERAAFLLHDVFDYDHGQVAAILEREPAAIRKLSERAREHVRASRPRFQPTREQSERLIGAFYTAVMQGDLDGLQRMLAEDAVLYSDGGGRVRAALNPLHGPDHISRFLVGITHKPEFGALTTRPTVVNGLPGALLFRDGVLAQTLAFQIDGDVIRGIHAVSNPEKLRGVVGA